MGLIILNVFFSPLAPFHSFLAVPTFSLIKGLQTASEQNALFAYWLHLCCLNHSCVSFWYFSRSKDLPRNTRKEHLAEIQLAESNVMNKLVLETMKCYHP